jgi:hypothetical protein
MAGIRTRKLFLIIEIHTGEILDQRYDRNESWKILDEYKRMGREVKLQAVCQ